MKKKLTVEDIEVGVRALSSVIADCIDKPELLDRGAKDYEDLFK